MSMLIPFANALGPQNGPAGDGAAPAGNWATSFWAQLDAAVAAETPDGPKGGPGRGT